MTLAESYESYQKLQTPESYDIFGQELLKFIKATVAKKFGSQFDQLEEAIGDSCIKVLEELPNFNPRLSPFPVWVGVIVRNSCTDILRGHQVDKEPTEEVPLEEADKPYDFFKNINIKIDLDRAINRLSEDDQELVHDKLAGLTDLEIAEEQGTTRQAVQKKFQRVIGELRTLLGGVKP